MVREPAIGEHVESKVGCFYLHGCKGMPPVLGHCFERIMRSGGSAKSLHQPSGCIGVHRGTEPKDDLALLSFRQLECHLHRCTRIECSANLAGKTCAVHGGRVAHRAIATEKFGAVAADRSSRFIDVKEPDPSREFAVVRVANIQSTTSRIDFGRYVHRRFRPHVAQYPLDIARSG